MPISVYPSVTQRQPMDVAELTAAVVENAVWIDLLRATPGEVAVVERALGIALPTREDMREIESTSRL